MDNQPTTPTADDSGAYTGELLERAEDAGVSVGFLTKLGVVASGLAAIVSGVAAVAHGDHSAETVTGLVVAGGIVYGVIRERGRQAAAKIAAALGPPPVLKASTLVAPPSPPVNVVVAGEHAAPAAVVEAMRRELGGVDAGAKRATGDAADPGDALDPEDALEADERVGEDADDVDRDDQIATA